jgi:hypothetical protein
VVAWQLGVIRCVRTLPEPEALDGAIVRAESEVGTRIVVT